MQTAKITVLCIALGFLLVVPFFGAPVIHLKNSSSSTLANITLHGKGFTKTMPDIAPGTEATIIVTVHGDSGLEIAFTVHGSPYKQGDLAYLESIGGTRVELEISSTFEVKNVTYAEEHRTMLPEFQPSRLLHIFD